VFAGVGFATAAYATDIGGLVIKGPPEIAPLTYNGITLYGIIDVSTQYESRGAPLNGPIYSSLGMISPINRPGSRWLIAPNQESQSFIGIKFEKELGYGVTLLAKAESGFVPTTGQLADGLGSLRLNNGIPLAQQTASADSARAGQLFNGELWLGASSPVYGNIYVGRLNNLTLDMIGGYDPMGGYGFSLVAYNGSLVGGGSGEDYRVDQSIKYTYRYGPVHVAGFYGAPGTNLKDIWQVNAGFDYKGFSFDAVGGHASDAVSAAALSGAAFLGSPFLGARVYDSNVYGAFAKYKFDLGAIGSKDESAFRRSITFSGGYSRIDFSNPSDGGFGVGHTTIGGYEIGPQLSTSGSAGSGVVNYAYTGGDRLLDVSFVGVKYQHDPKWSFAAAYYRFDQNSFGFGVPKLQFYNGTSYSSTKCSSSSFTNCSGVEQVASIRADYQWSKNLNLYAGAAWSRVDDGLAFGYQEKEMYSTTLGARFAF
jgi:predicted porin